MNSTATKKGGRIVELFLPITIDNSTINEIHLSLEWGHTLDWKEGRFTSMFDLLVAVADQPMTVLRKMKYPDVDRVLSEFVQMLPAEIRDDLATGQKPLPILDQVEEQVEQVPIPTKEELPEQLFPMEHDADRVVEPELEEEEKAPPFNYDALPHIPKGGFPGEEFPEDFTALKDVRPTGTGDSGFDLEK